MIQNKIPAPGSMTADEVSYYAAALSESFKKLATVASADLYISASLISEQPHMRVWNFQNLERRTSRTRPIAPGFFYNTFVRGSTRHIPNFARSLVRGSTRHIPSRRARPRSLVSWPSEQTTVLVCAVVAGYVNLNEVNSRQAAAAARE